MFAEDIDAFLADFGVTATFSSESANVIFDQPDQVLGGGDIISADYNIQYKTGVFAALKYNDTITVNGASYKVRAVRKLEDGALTAAELSKV